jgi:hypothetical protein
MLRPRLRDTLDELDRVYVELSAIAVVAGPRSSLANAAADATPAALTGATAYRGRRRTQRGRIRRANRP